MGENRDNVRWNTVIKLFTMVLLTASLVAAMIVLRDCYVKKMEKCIEHSELHSTECQNGHIEIVQTTTDGTISVCRCAADNRDH